MHGFTIYAKCEVWYEGRAKSYLELGKYLIIRKDDGTLLIHGATLTTPLNYQPPGAKLTVEKTDKGIIMTSTRKNEVIRIKIHEMIDKIVTDGWSNNEIEIWGTEGHLRGHIIANIDQYFPNHVEVHVEYATPVGPVDLLVVQKADAGREYCVIEIKRKKATLAAVSQLGRYIQHFREVMKVKAIGYIFSPDITTNALTHLHFNGCHHVGVEIPQITGAFGDIAGPRP